MPAEQKQSRQTKLGAIVDRNLEILKRPPSGADPDITSSSSIEREEVRTTLRRDRSMGEIELAKIRPDPKQVRHVDVDGDSFRDLVASVQKHGVLTPITVRWVPAADLYEIVTGERRYRASLAAGLKTVRAVVQDVDDTSKAIQQLVENLQRENMNPVEEAKAFQLYLVATGGTQDQLAQEIGKSKVYVSQMMTILEKLTIDEQNDLAKVTPAKLPGRTLILEAIRIPDAEIRRAILRGEINREEARAYVPRSKSDGRTKYTSHRYEFPELQAKVTVTIQRAGASDQEIRGALEAALKEQQKRDGKTGGGLRRLVGKGR